MATGPKGQKHLCAGCGNWHESHRPDNCTQVPVCQECWKKLSMNVKVWSICLAKMDGSVRGLDDSVRELLEGIVQTTAALKQGTGTDYSDN